jgi:hypothetical protein
MYMRMRRHLKSRQNHNIVAYLPGNATNNLWVLDLTLDLLDIPQAKLQLIITFSNLLEL